MRPQGKSQWGPRGEFLPGCAEWREGWHFPPTFLTGTVRNHPLPSKKPPETGKSRGENEPKSNNNHTEKFSVMLFKGRKREKWELYLCALRRKGFLKVSQDLLPQLVLCCLHPVRGHRKRFGGGSKPPCKVAETPPAAWRLGRDQRDAEEKICTSRRFVCENWESVCSLTDNSAELQQNMSWIFLFNFYYLIFQWVPVNQLRNQLFENPFMPVGSTFKFIYVDHISTGICF